ncbi:MAG: hydrogenase maturation nickel metallochaperone HypA [Candidatus Helarchaeota archaeon]|nr:hydrogenase maturation nickel metallochaperone HypA [Candidatus Helarchaeota archaeon]
MHEFATAQNIVRIVTRAAMQNNARKISEVRLELGEFTFINPQQLKFVFEIAAKDSPAEGAELNISKIPGKIGCTKCGYKGGLKYTGPEIHSTVAAQFVLDCPKCESKETEIIGGRELRIKDIKIEV